MIIPGNATHSRTVITSIAMNGQIFLHMSVKEHSAIPDVTYSSTPTGGVICPIRREITMTTAKNIGLNP